MQNMLPEEEVEDETSELDAQSLEDLIRWAEMGMAKDARGRMGKAELPLEGEGGELDAAAGAEGMPPAEDAEIPGVEAVPDEGGGGPDVEKLRAVLAKLKAG